MRPIPPARITSPIPTGGTYERPSFIQPRIAGSSDRYSSCTVNCPSEGSGAGSSTYSQSDGLGSPTGRAASRHCAFIAVIGASLLERELVPRMPAGGSPEALVRDAFAVAADVVYTAFERRRGEQRVSCTAGVTAAGSNRSSSARRGA